MTTNSTTRRKAPTKTTTGQGADGVPDLVAMDAEAQRIIAESRAVTGMQEVYDAVDEAVGVPDIKRRMLRRRLDTTPVEVDGLGTLMMRGLAQPEIKEIKAEAAEWAGRPDAPADQDTLFEWLLVSRALVEPRLTAEEVGEYFACAPAGEALEVMSAVQRLSGMERGSAKSGVPAV